MTLYWQPRYLKNWDWWLGLLVIAITSFGMAVMASAAAGLGPDEAKSMVIKQSVAALLGIIAWVGFTLFDYTEFRHLYRFLYGLSILLLVLVLLVGVERNGSKSWLNLGVVQMQPAELSKVLLILTLGKQLEGMERLEAWSDLLLPILHVLPIFALVVLQGDLGTALVIATLSVIMVYAAGFPGRKILAVLLTVGLVVGGMVYSHYRWNTNLPLKDHQWERIDTFLYPEKNLGGAGYQVFESKITIGNGGLLGQGYRQGAQARLGFLPFQYTDFIFAVLVEEWGMVGGLGVLALFALVFFRLGYVAGHAKDQYGMLITMGVTGMIGAHVLENIGMTMGVTPVTGIPLPFISYGPTALLANMVAIGIVQSVAVHRETLSFGGA